MAEEVVRVKEREKESNPRTSYDNVLTERAEFIQYQMTGKLLIKDSDREWEMCKQGYLKYHLQPHTYSDHALRNWQVFVQDIRAHSGKHRHQGGSLTIFALEGEGYSICDGVRRDWKAGDLLLLPLKPGGVEHQHFNSKPGSPCKWLAFIYLPYQDEVGTEVVQVELSPDYK